MTYYPLFLDITGRRCLVVGGGEVAARKVERLLACGARVTVVAPVLGEALSALREAGRIEHRGEAYGRSALSGAFLAIGATDDDAVNGQISRDARALGVPVNIVDDPARCDFILPAVVERGDLAIAVSTGGKSPALARLIRIALEAAYGPEYAVLVALLGRVREAVLARGGGADANRACVEALLAADLPRLIREGRREEVQARIQEIAGVRIEVDPW